MHSVFGLISLGTSGLWQRITPECGKVVQRAALVGYQGGQSSCCSLAGQAAAALLGHPPSPLLFHPPSSPQIRLSIFCNAESTSSVLGVLGMGGSMMSNTYNTANTLY